MTHQAQQSRSGYEIQFLIKDSETDTAEINIEHGVFGTIIVPAGSNLIGKVLQFVAVSQNQQVPAFAPTELLNTGITLAAGANALSEQHIRECGAASRVKLRVNSAVSGDSPFVMLWKS